MHQTCVCVCVCASLCTLSCVQLFVSPWTVTHQASLSMAFSRQGYWSGLLFPTPGYLSDPGIKHTSLASLALAGRFFTISARWEAQTNLSVQYIGIIIKWAPRSMAATPWRVHPLPTTTIHEAMRALLVTHSIFSITWRDHTSYNMSYIHGHSGCFQFSTGLTILVYASPNPSLYNATEQNLWANRYIHIRTCVCSVTQLCPTLCDPVDCSPSGSTVHGTF